MSEIFDNFSKSLQGTDRRAKVSCLREFQSKYEDPRATTETILSSFDECYLLILKCYEDRFESVRQAAVEVVSGFIERLPPSDFHVANVVQVLKERMGSLELVEESEELRLLYTKQLKALIEQYIATGNARYLSEYHADMSIILDRALQDPYPAVQVEACECLQILAKAAGERFEFQPYAERLVVPTYGILNHKHFTCRLAALEALGQCALHLDASGESLKRLLMEVSPLLMDFMPKVREGCGKLGGLLLLKLSDRYSYFDRIIPLVLCCLKDDSPEVVASISSLWLQCGKQYYNENELELNKQDMSDPPAPNYPPDVQRPFIGCRALVQRCLRLLPLITRESSDWKENVRVHSLKLLQQFVLHAEAFMTAKFFEIYPDVARACRDPAKEVVQEAFKACDVMGRLLKYADWSEHGFEGLSKNHNVGYLRCFYHMFKSSLDVPREDMYRLAEILSNPDFSQSLKPEMQEYVLKMVLDLLEKSDNLADELTTLTIKDSSPKDSFHRNLYVATVKVLALQHSVNKERPDESVLEQLTTRMRCTVPQLHERFMKDALGYVYDLDAPLEEVSEPIHLLDGLLSLGGFRKPYLDTLQRQLLDVFEHCSDEAKVKVFCCVSVAMLQWHDTIGCDLEESTKLLQEFTTTIVEPRLIWHAGANAESMRSMATGTICSMSQGAAAEAQVVLPTVAKHMTGLLEDRSTETRHYAVRSLLNFGELSMDQMKPIAYAVLQRLNDPSTTVRRYAIMAIPRLKPAINLHASEGDENKEQKFDLDIWHTFIQKAADMLYLHYDGPMKDLRDTLKDAIRDLGATFPTIMKERYELTVAGSYSTGSDLKKLKEEMAFLN